MTYNLPPPTKPGAVFPCIVNTALQTRIGSRHLSEPRNHDTALTVPYGREINGRAASSY